MNMLVGCFVSDSSRYDSFFHVALRFDALTPLQSFFLDILMRRDVSRWQGLKYRLVPLGPDDKPEWLIDGYGGKMPCLIHEEEVRTGFMESKNHAY
jgi:hypothetical protein